MGLLGGYWVGDRGLNPLEDQTVIGLLSDTGHPWISQNFQASVLDVSAIIGPPKWRFAGNLNGASLAGQ